MDAIIRIAKNNKGIEGYGRIAVLRGLVGSQNDMFMFFLKG